MTKWTAWTKFPDPRKQEFIHAPFGPGVYEVRNRHTKEPILFGRGGNCAYRMASLLPKPFGAGGRINVGKRSYVLKNIGDLDYRCCACLTKTDAINIERNLKKEKSFMFPRRLSGNPKIFTII